MPHTYGDAGADAADAEAPGAAAHQRSADKHGGGAEGQCLDHVGACTASFSSEPGSTREYSEQPNEKISTHGHLLTKLLTHTYTHVRALARARKCKIRHT